MHHQISGTKINSESDSEDHLSLTSKGAPVKGLKNCHFKKLHKQKWDKSIRALFPEIPLWRARMSKFRPKIGEFHFFKHNPF